MLAIILGVDQQLARSDFLLQERKHGRLVFLHRDGRAEAVLEQFAKVAGSDIHRNAGLRPRSKRASRHQCVADLHSSILWSLHRWRRWSRGVHRLRLIDSDATLIHNRRRRTVLWQI